MGGRPPSESLRVRGDPPIHVRRRHCTERTFDYWCLGTDLNRQFGPAYGAPTPLFHKDNVERVADDVNALLRKV